MVQPAGNLICSQSNSAAGKSKLFRPHSGRICHRKGCSNRFLPRRPHQKFCRETQCDVELRRWQATKRQRRHRASPENRAKHAERERVRRIENASRTVSEINPLTETVPQTQPTAWSRPNVIPKDFCDRPGCYEPQAPSDRNHAKYCGNACRNAVHRVRERDRSYRTARYRWPKSTVNYSGSSRSSVPLLHPKRSNKHDSKTSSQSRPRSPPTAT